MKKTGRIISMVLAAVAVVSAAHAQDRQTVGRPGTTENLSRVVAYDDYRPAQVTLTDGRTMTVPRANVFLKKSTLVYKSGAAVKEASMQAIAAVDFGDRQYLKIDSVLAFLVDTVGENAVYERQVIDREAYEASFRNDRMITGIQYGEQINLITLDPQRDSTALYPVVNTFYYRYNGKIMKVHDRELWRQLSKDKRRIMQSMMAEPGFSWTRCESVIRMLQALTGTLFE